MGLMNYTGHSILETGAELFGKKFAKTRGVFASFHLLSIFAHFYLLSIFAHFFLKSALVLVRAVLVRLVLVRLVLVRLILIRLVLVFLHRAVVVVLTLGHLILII